MNTLNYDTSLLKDLVNENTRYIKEEMYGKFRDQSAQLHELNQEIRRLRQDMQDSRIQFRDTIYRWIFGFLFVLVYIMAGILILKK